MKRVAWICGLSLCLLTIVSEARADWHSFWDRVHLDFHRMNCWPEPFQAVDRQVTAAPVVAMMNNGWRMQNTITDQLFDLETQELTSAGELKLRYILTQHPSHRRTVYVLRGDNPQATAARLASVEQMVGGLAGDNARPDVMLTNFAPEGGSGRYYDRVLKGYESTTPSPRLPQMTSEGGN